MTAYWLNQDHPANLQDHFTVVWWAQRGAGLSFEPDLAPETMTTVQFVADTLAVTRYLAQMKSVITGIFLPSLQFREYTLGEKYRLCCGKIASRSADYGLWSYVLATDLAQKVTELAVPADLFHGRHDYTRAYPLAKAYLDKLKTPVKGF
jgi:pimeloyl-ACP methyl ester carboxylesterase